MRQIVSVILVIALLGCSEQQPQDAAVDYSSLPSLEAEIQKARGQLSDAARSYLEAALDTVQAIHPIADQFDWEEWRLASLERARGAEQFSDTYASLTEAIMELPGGHGHFRRPDSTQELWGRGNADSAVLFKNSLEQIDVTLAANRYGHVVVPGFPVEEREQSDSLATVLHRRTQSLESQTCGWVIDLRSNTGGNMWPMLSGLASFLGDGPVGYFTGRDDRDVPWIVEDGSARLDTMILASVDDVDVVDLSSSPVALLISPRTGSSGEALAIAFRGRNNTQFFGQPTAGATSSPTRIQLEDGAVIGFAKVFFSDRDRYLYSGPVEPDELIEVRQLPGEDPVLDSALDWLASHSDCSAR